MATRTTPRHADRIVNTTTGQTGTIVETHTDTKPKGSPPNYSVLLDNGPRACVIWQGFEAEWKPGPARKCHRCESTDHTAITCPEGDMP